MIPSEYAKLKYFKWDNLNNTKMMKMKLKSMRFKFILIIIIQIFICCVVAPIRPRYFFFVLSLSKRIFLYSRKNLLKCISILYIKLNQFHIDCSFYELRRVMCCPRKSVFLKSTKDKIKRRAVIFSLDKVKVG